MSSNKYCIIYMIAIFTIPSKSYGNENNHLCEEIVTRSTDDGLVFNDKVLVCCPGYTVDTSGKCIPFCERPCIYGFCKAPNVCECIEGYKLMRNQCVPMCRKKCINGYCRKPEICGCLSGFELDSKDLTSCIPVCNPKCSNFSKCTQSIQPFQNICQCITGYTENFKTKRCEPKCESKCHNSFCSAPETCECFNGFELDNANKTKCIPKCEPNCQLYSSCTAPNICRCKDGYKLNETSKICEPICKDQIKNSRCIKPPNTWICIENYQHDIRTDNCVLESCLCNSNGYCLEYRDKCECYEGFTKNTTTGQCEPTCHPNCENSICVSNNVCQCLDDYHRTPEDHICEKNEICNSQPCKNGECLITGECKCKAGYIKSFSYNGQLECEKLQNFIGKIMTMVLGVPIVLAVLALIALYIIAKKKSNNVEEQELILIERH